MQRARHAQRFPLRRQAHLARLARAEREPIAARLPFRIQQIRKLDRHIPDDGVLEEVAVVNRLDGDSGRRFVGAEELVRRFPDWTCGVLEATGGEGRATGAVDVDPGEWVEVAGERLALVEFLGLMDDETHDSDS